MSARQYWSPQLLVWSPIELLHLPLLPPLTLPLSPFLCGMSASAVVTSNSRFNSLHLPFSPAGARTHAHWYEGRDMVVWIMIESDLKRIFESLESSSVALLFTSSLFHPQLSVLSLLDALSHTRLPLRTHTHTHRLSPVPVMLASASLTDSFRLTLSFSVIQSYSHLPRHQSSCTISQPYLGPVYGLSWELNTSSI